jgi:hypothetical protein
MHLPASGGDGARVDSKVSICKLSNSVVKPREPKMLLGSHCGEAWRLRAFSTMG